MVYSFCSANPRTSAGSTRADQYSRPSAVPCLIKFNLGKTTWENSLVNEYFKYVNIFVQSTPRCHLTEHPLNFSLNSSAAFLQFRFFTFQLFFSTTTKSEQHVTSSGKRSGVQCRERGKTEERVRGTALKDSLHFPAALSETFYKLDECKMSFDLMPWEDL